MISINSLIRLTQHDSTWTVSNVNHRQPTHTTPMKSIIRHTLLLVGLATLAGTATSCLPLAAGAAAGYVAHDEGYRVQSPLTKDE